MGFRNEISVLYFPLLLSLQVTFNKKEDNMFSYFIFLTVCSTITISYIYDFRLFSFNLLNADYEPVVRITAYFDSFILTISCGKLLIFENQRRKLLHNQSEQNKIQIVEIKQQSDRIKKYIFSNNLVHLLNENDEQFIPLFNEYFPDLLPNILAKSFEVSVDEFKLCAYIKMGLTTKEISYSTGLTVRTVQTKKNRLRKTLEIPSEINIYNWIECQ